MVVTIAHKTVKGWDVGIDRVAKGGCLSIEGEHVFLEEGCDRLQRQMAQSKNLPDVSNIATYQVSVMTITSARHVYCCF